MKPIIVYYNIELNILKILEEIKGKSGIYRLVNTNNGKSYIGSSKNIYNRFKYMYFSKENMIKSLKNNRSIIYHTLVKYGYANFKLEILEYCDKKSTFEREQYYLYKLNPEYNILKIAGEVKFKYKK